MAKKIFTVEDLLVGCEQLKQKKKFTPGFDKMTPDAAEIWLGLNGEELCKQMNNGKYKPMPAVGFNVAKSDGKYRRLVRVTAIDTVVQYTVMQKVGELCESMFSDDSFAYRKGRGVADALNRFCVYAEQYPLAVKSDIRNCFDTLDFDVAKGAFEAFFTDPRTVSLFMSFMKMPVLEEGLFSDRKKGILQGLPIGGLICNIYLHSLDSELTKKGIPFIRYADDIVVFARDKEEATNSSAFLSDYLTKNLHLSVNTGKSHAQSVESTVFLGHRFIRQKSGSVEIKSTGASVSAYCDWYSERPRNHRTAIDILSDGILRQKDFSAIFETETETKPLPLSAIERINIFSSVIFDRKFLEVAMNAGVYVNVFGRDYSCIGRFVPTAPLKAPILISEQISAYSDTDRRLALAKEFDLASLHNLRLNIRYYHKQNGNGIYLHALEQIDSIFEKMKLCHDYEKLLLLEAQARAFYFGCFDSFLEGSPFSFDKRTRQPPQNEVNSMLSFGNVVLYNYIATELYKSSLDIRIGYLHATNKRPESLNLDIAEIFKPLIVDRVVFSQINRCEIQPYHFERVEGGGIYLTEEGKRRVLDGFYEKLSATVTVGGEPLSYAQLIDREIQKLTRYFRKGEKYKAYRQVR